MVTHLTGNAHRVSTILAVALLVVGCGTSGPAPSTSASAPASAPASVTPTTTPTSTATPVPEPSPIDPGTVLAAEPMPRLWTASGAPAKVTRAGNPGLDPQGRIWVVALDQKSEFWIFDGDDGTFVEAWGTAGDGDGEFDFRRENDTFGSVAFAADGSFYIAEAGNHRVQHFSADRTFLAKFGTFGTADDQFVTPNLLKLDADGNVYVKDDELGAIKMFRPDGAYVRSFPGTYPFFHVDDRGHVYSVEDDKILREYDPDGRVVRGIDLSRLVDFVSAIVVDDRGHMWIGSNREEGPLSYPDRLLELDPDGRLIHDWDGMAIDGIVLDPDGGRLYAGFFEPDFLAAYAIPAE